MFCRCTVDLVLHCAPGLSRYRLVLLAHERFLGRCLFKEVPPKQFPTVPLLEILHRPKELFTYPVGTWGRHNQNKSKCVLMDSTLTFTSTRTANVMSYFERVLNGNEVSALISKKHAKVTRSAYLSFTSQDASPDAASFPGLVFAATQSFSSLVIIPPGLLIEIAVWDHRNWKA